MAERPTKFRHLNLTFLYAYCPFGIFASIYAGVVVATGCARGEPICGLAWYDGFATTSLLLTAFVVGPITLSWLVRFRATIQIEHDVLHLRSRVFVHWKIPLSEASGRPLGSSGDKIRLVIRATPFGIPVRVIDIEGPMPLEVRRRLLSRPPAGT